MYIAATSYGIVRSLQDQIEEDQVLRSAIYAMLVNSVESLTKCVRLFPQAERDELMDLLLEAMIGSTGYALEIR